MAASNAESSMEVEGSENESINGKIEAFIKTVKGQISGYNGFFNDFNFEKLDISKSSKLSKENIKNLLI